MKRLALTIAFLLIAQFAFANVYVIYRTDDRSVYSLSNEDDATMPASGYTKEVLKKNLEDLQLQYPFTFFDYKGGKFIVNTDKVKAQIDTEIQDQERAKEEKIIQDKIRTQAIDELKKEGQTFKYIEEAK